MRAKVRRKKKKEKFKTTKKKRKEGGGGNTLQTIFRIGEGSTTILRDSIVRLFHSSWFALFFFFLFLSFSLPFSQNFFYRFFLLSHFFFLSIGDCQIRWAYSNRVLVFKLAACVCESTVRETFSVYPLTCPLREQWLAERYYEWIGNSIFYLKQFPITIATLQCRSILQFLVAYVNESSQRNVLQRNNLFYISIIVHIILQ